MMKPNLEDLVEELAEIAIEEMDCEHNFDHEEDGVHHSVNYNLSKKWEKRATLAIEQWLKNRCKATLVE